MSNLCFRGALTPGRAAGSLRAGGTVAQHGTSREGPDRPRSHRARSARQDPHARAPAGRPGAHLGAARRPRRPREVQRSDVSRSAGLVHPLQLRQRRELPAVGRRRGIGRAAALQRPRRGYRRRGHAQGDASKSRWAGRDIEENGRQYRNGVVLLCRRVPPRRHGPPWRRRPPGGDRPRRHRGRRGHRDQGGNHRRGWAASGPCPTTR